MRERLSAFFDVRDEAMQDDNDVVESSDSTTEFIDCLQAHQEAVRRLSDHYSLLQDLSLTFPNASELELKWKDLTGQFPVWPETWIPTNARSFSVL